MLSLILLFNFKFSKQQAKASRVINGNEEFLPLENNNPKGVFDGMMMYVFITQPQTLFIKFFSYYK